MKSIYYNVYFIHSEDKEEKSISKKFEGSDIFKCRNDAFTYLKELYFLHEDEFFIEDPLIVPKLFVSFNIVYEDYDFDDGMKIYFDRVDNYPLYMVSTGELKKFEENHQKEISTLSKIWDYQDEEKLKMLKIRLFSQTGEEHVIVHFIGKRINDPETNSFKKQDGDYQLLKCTRCGKTMEVETIVAERFIEKRNRRKDVWISCSNCIQAYYSNPYFNFYSQEVYDKNGISQLKNKPDLLSALY